jgi:hypothetical protein
MRIMGYNTLIAFYHHPDRPMRAPVRYDVHGSGAASRANEAHAPRDRQEQHIIIEAERSECERRRVQASRVRACHEQAFGS